MPTVIVKMHAGRDESIKSKLADDLFQTMQDVLNVPPQALTIDIQDTPREEWDEKVKSVEIEPRKDEMYYLAGKKQR
jgi:phenylpyruvate tautomerase PptA (4-oxalocrotonate tautomerase family)